MPSKREQVSDQDYRTLGLTPDASLEDVKRAYRELAKRWHPDKFQGHSVAEQQRAEELFKEITASYHRISTTGKIREAFRAERAATRESSAASSDERGRDTFTRASASSPGGKSAGPAASPSGAADGPDFSEKLFNSIKNFASRYGPAGGNRIVFFSVLGAIVVLAGILFVVPRLSHQPPVYVPEAPFSVKGPETIVSQGSAGSTTTEEAERSAASSTLRSASRAPQPVLKPSDAGLPYFSLGSPQDEVLRIQGAPGKVRGQVWVYGLSEVGFKEGRVARYDNFNGNLQVRLMPSESAPNPPPETFTLGSTADEVLLVQGTPTRVDEYRWYFGFSVITFKNERVAGFDNSFGDLKVRMTPSASSTDSRKDYFSIGSSQDEVIEVQGTPTKVQGSSWFYQLSSVLFREGKVHSVNDSSSSLNFRPPMEDAAPRAK